MDFNISFKKSNNRYSDKELFECIESTWSLLGRQPKCSEITGVHFGTFFNRFGSWKNALLKFSEYKKNGVCEEKDTKVVMQKRVALNNSIRFDIMKRDNFKCKLCGDSPAVNTLCKLEVDHILPISKNGDNRESNLQTLCSVCSSGKGNK